MKSKNKIELEMLVLIAIALTFFSGIVSADYMRSTPQYTLYQETHSHNFSESMCQAGQDFIIQVAPFGCTPAVVRSDLLEEQDVPVYCKLSATKINPLINVEAINSISFLGKIPAGVKGMGFHPASSALGTSEKLNSPVLENIGYAVIVLKKQKELEMPDFVQGNLTAKIKYDIKNAFGIGDASFYLSEMNDDAWGRKYSQYSFWGGKGFLRATRIENDGATISVYSDESNVFSVFDLKKGENPKRIYIPGFDCLAGLNVKLEDVKSQGTRAKLRVNADVIEVEEGEKFFDNKCTLKNIEKKGLVQKARINCRDDKQSKSFEIILAPMVKVSINEKIKDVTVGDFLYRNEKDKKSVYLGYAGTMTDSEKIDDLFLYLYEVPETLQRKVLSEKEISYANYLAEQIKDVNALDSGFLDFTSDILKAYAITGNWVYKRIKDGENFALLKYKDKSGKVVSGKIFNSNISIVGFAGPQDEEFEAGIKGNYTNALNDYDVLAESFSSEKEYESDKETLGEKALYNKIILARDLEQKKTMAEFCEEFREQYPNSAKDLSDCDNKYKLSSSESAKENVLVNGKISTIYFDGIIEPGFNEYGATIRVKSASGVESFDLRKNQIQYLSSSEQETIQLISLDDNSAKVKINLLPESWTSKVSKEFKEGFYLDAKTLEKDVPENFGSSYMFTLTDVNIEKAARVKISPDIDYIGTTAEFGFKIGIEKRAIKLSPEKIKEKLSELNKTITEWGERSEILGETVEGLKAACLGTGVVLTVKNFFSNLGGTAIARQSAMRGEGGWYEKCASAVSTGKIENRNVDYKTINECFTKEADNIDKDVAKEQAVIEKQNSEFKKLQEGITKGEFFGDSVVDDKEFAKRYFPKVQSSLNSFKIVNDPYSKNLIDVSSSSTVSKAFEVDESGRSLVSIEDVRDIEKYLMLLESYPDDETVERRLYSKIEEIKNAVQQGVEQNSFIKTLNANPAFSNIGVGLYSSQGAITGIYDSGKTISQFNEIPTGVPVQAIVYQGNKYILQLGKINDKEFIVVSVYDKSGKLLNSTEANEIKKRFQFKEYDTSFYKNEYKNPKLKYFGSEPYKNLPAIVPFDVNNGWYTAVRQTLPLGATIQGYDASGRVRSYWVCNVGRNGIEENIGGDDVCEMINIGTGQPYNQFPGLSEKEAFSLVKDAEEAIEQASRAYKAGINKVKINVGRGSIYLDVGTPMVDIPDMQCQDFMSPKDCLVLFNVCDPVICPSSRCDFGGQYPVRDVIQSGIIGSIALCLPNYREGIVVPVCLTGVKAGIDSLLSVFKAYRDCLQSSLDDGETIGICDEIYSVHLCEFFWRQSLPLANLAVPKVLEIILGENVRGGGEYFGVASAWSTAQKSIDYFTQSYAVNSYKAFKARTTEEIGGEICKNFASGVYPVQGDLLASMTQADSPPQFHGRFDEIIFTTTTNPPISHYKVFYHIYAGLDSGVYYKVYLRGAEESSYYQDTSSMRIVASGYIAKGDYASDTPDFTAPSGYKELCINVNGQEECGFKQVSTSLAVDIIKDEYMKEQSTQTDIRTEEECVSGSASVYSLLNPNVQEGVQEVIDPAIYSKGIIRICSSGNPGKTTDPYIGTESARWIQVGACNKKIKCWLDTKSVKNVIEAMEIEEETLKEATQDYLEVLKNQGGYLSNEEFSSKEKEIEKAEADEKVEIINLIIDKVFFNREKALLFFWRGNAYSEIAKITAGIITVSVKKEEVKDTEATTKTETQTEETEELEKFDEEKKSEDAKTQEKTTTSEEKKYEITLIKFFNARTNEKIEDFVELDLPIYLKFEVENCERIQYEVWRDNDPSITNWVGWDDFLMKEVTDDFDKAPVGSIGKEGKHYVLASCVNTKGEKISDEKEVYFEVKKPESIGEAEGVYEE